MTLYQERLEEMLRNNQLTKDEYDFLKTFTSKEFPSITEWQRFYELYSSGKLSARLVLDIVADKKLHFEVLETFVYWLGLTLRYLISLIDDVQKYLSEKEK